MRGEIERTNISPEIVTTAEFQRRVAQLCLGRGLTAFPRKQRDRHILLKSVVLTLNREAEYSEPELNPKLQLWLSRVGASFHLDHVNLRRHLIDEEFLGRSKDGHRYWVAVSSRRQLRFDPEIDSLDFYGLLARVKAEEARRRELFSQDQQSPTRRWVIGQS